MHLLLWYKQLVSPAYSSHHFRSNSNKFSLVFNSAWIEDSNIRDFDQFKDSLSKKCKTASFKEAMAAIESYRENPAVS